MLNLKFMSLAGISVVISSTAIGGALSTPPQDFYKHRVITKDIGNLTLSVPSSTMECYVDQTWDQGEISFEAEVPLEGTNSTHQKWTRSLEGDGTCDELTPPVAFELRDGMIDVTVVVKTKMAVWYQDKYPLSKCTFRIWEEARANHPAIGTYESSQIISEIFLSAETCKQAFSDWAEGFPSPYNDL